MPLPSLHLDKVAKTFDDLRAVDGVSLRVEAGERVAVIGPNGAGKTTTLLMALGAIEPDEGTVHIGRFELPRQRARAMGGVGFAAGYLPLPDRLRVQEALAFFAELSGVEDTDRAVRAVTEDLEIGYLRTKLCMSLSSGQRTLVGIAKAVLHHPGLLILDEPTASLDPDVALRVRDRLAAIADEHGTTLVLTSHDMREVEALCDRVVFLRAGAVIADGPPARIVADAGFADLEDLFLAEAARMRSEQL
jgi:ABC-2 type transport system ATP-binding protein